MKKTINADIALSKANSNKNSPTDVTNNTLNGTIEYQNTSTVPTKNNISNYEENRKEETKYNSKMNKKMHNVEDKVNEEEIIESRSNKFKEEITKKDNVKSQYHINRSKDKFVEDPEENYRKRKEVIMIKIDENNNESENLAEMFKKKKLGLIEKLEKRKIEKETKVFQEKEKPSDEQVKSRTKFKKSLIKDENKKEITNTTKFKEPSEELLHRLSFGEKANV